MDRQTPSRITCSVSLYLHRPSHTRQIPVQISDQPLGIDPDVLLTGADVCTDGCEGLPAMGNESGQLPGRDSQVFGCQLQGAWLGYFSRSISASLWFICGSSFLPAPRFKGTHVFWVLIEPDDCLQKCGAQELLLRTGNQAGGYFDCASHEKYLPLDNTHTQTAVDNHRLVDSAVILPSPYSFVNHQSIKW